MISIVISTFGDWPQRHPELLERAINSAMSQNNSELVYVHGDTLAKARNSGAASAKGDRLVFLDGDDWLEPGFCDSIVQKEDVLQPLTRRFFPDGRVESPHYFTPAGGGLVEGNHLIVGCPVNRQKFLDLGGFDEYPILEDWALWLKMYTNGASFGKTRGIYNIQIREGSRNSGESDSVVEKIRNEQTKRKANP